MSRFPRHYQLRETQGRDAFKSAFASATADDAEGSLGLAEMRVGLGCLKSIGRSKFNGHDLLRSQLSETLECLCLSAWQHENPSGDHTHFPGINLEWPSDVSASYQSVVWTRALAPKLKGVKELFTCFLDASELANESSRNGMTGSHAALCKMCPASGSSGQSGPAP